MSAIQDIIDGADDKIEGLTSAILSVDDQIATYTDQQNEFIASLNQLDTELNDYLDSTSVGDWTFTHSNYYSGTPLSLDDNISDWQRFTTLDNSLTVIDDTSVTVVEISNFSVGQTVYFKLTSNTYPIDSAAIDSIDGNDLKFSGDVVPLASTALLELVYEPGGVGWDSNADIQGFMDEFQFINEQIWTPLGVDGTFGTKANIASMGTAKTLLENDKQNAEDSKTALARFS